MTKIHQQIVVDYPRNEVFALINDIEKYPDFVPGCIGAKVLSKKNNEIIATLDVEKGGIRQSFTTKNTLLADTEIALSLVDGPFKTLQGSWFLKSISDSKTEVALILDVVFQGYFLDVAFGAIFKSIMHNMLQAFQKRAQEIYG